MHSGGGDGSVRVLARWHRHLIQPFAGASVEHSEQPVLPHRRDQIAAPVAHCRPKQRARVCQVPIVVVARHELRGPPQRPGSDVEHDDRVGVQVLDFCPVTLEEPWVPLLKLVARDEERG